MRHFLIAVPLIGMLAMMTANGNAADVGTIDCVMTRMSAPERSAVVRSAQAMASGDGATLPPAAKMSVHVAAQACAKRYGWTAHATDAAESNTFGILADEPIRTAIRATGNDPVVWIRVLSSLSEPMRDAIVLGRDDAVTAYDDALTKAGANLSKPDSLRLAGLLAGMRFMVEESHARFMAG